VGANFVEARESVSSRDFLLRLRICKKEAMESLYWIQLIKAECPENQISKLDNLADESRQLGRIFGSILQKSKS